MTLTSDIIGGLIATAVLLFLNGTLAAARAGLVNASRGRLRQLAQDGVSGASLAVRVAEDATPLLATLRLAQTFCRFGSAGLVALIFTPLLRDTFLSWWPFPGQAAPLAFSVLIVVVTMLVIAVGEFLPEALALRNAEESAITFAPVVAVLEWVLGPLVRLLLLFLAGSLVMRSAGCVINDIVDRDIDREVERTRLILKPRRHIDDLVFKTDVCKLAHEWGEVIASFENEPKNLVAMQKALGPKVMHIFYESVSSDHAAPAGKEVYKINTFEL